MISEKLKFDLQGYIENAVQCSGHGTYMCGICACAPDFFGRRCECDAENMNFGGDLVSDLTIQLFVYLSLLLQKCVVIFWHHIFVSHCTILVGKITGYKLENQNLNLAPKQESGCRPDNTTTTLCNNRGDCICGKCECYPRENPEEVRMKSESNGIQ